ncbi:hypothetical protein WMF39_11415 [Sorangium sp. So ce1504]|uniref:hypothetical protein n=1 Tax=Sorangium sp. So ce1504 TaxID=3133337 RepID=UPI003F61A2D7
MTRSTPPRPAGGARAGRGGVTTEETMYEHLYAAYAQTKILEKYGTLHGISKELVERVFENKATPEELKNYEENAVRLVDHFVTDMRRTELKDLSRLDKQIVTAIDATNYVNFQRSDEPYAKVVPGETVIGLLKNNNPPAFFGFGASRGRSENLSPVQIVPQFGLDYTGSDYVIKDGDISRPVPFLFIMVTPMTEALKKQFRVPLDPLIFDAMEGIANDTEEDPILREMGSLMTRPDVAAIAVRGALSDDEMKARTQKYKDRGYSVRKKSAEPPYTGLGSSQHGATLEGQDFHPEMGLETMAAPSDGETPVGGKGTYIDLLVPKPASTGTRDPTLPWGQDRIRIAAWDRDWNVTASKEEVDRGYERAVAGYSDEVKAGLQKSMVAHGAMMAANKEGLANAPAGVASKPETKKGLKDHTKAAKRSIVRKTLGSVVAALRFMNSDKDKNKDRNKKKKKKNVDGSDDRQESTRKRASGE